MSAAGEGVVIFIATLAVGPGTLLVLRRARVFDHPSSRSAHDVPVPRGGGVAPLCGVLVGLVISAQLSGGQRTALILTSIGFGLLGLGEDLIGIPPWARLAAQTVLAAVPVTVVLGESTIWPQRLLWVLLGVVWVVSFTNVFNFMDGIDGISVAQATATGIVWLLAGVTEDVPAFAAGGAFLAAGALGFAPFNLPHARMFLGDCGSYFLGSLAALVAVIGLRGGLPPEVIAFPVGLYVVDSGLTLCKRVWRGEHPFLPHDQHIYQQWARSTSHLHAAGMVFLTVTACSALGLVSLLGNTALRIMADLAVVVILAAYLISPAIFRTATPTGRL